MLALLLVSEAAVTLGSTGEAFAVSDHKAGVTVVAKPRPATTGSLSAPDAASALATARLRRRKVEILDQLTPRTTTWANPNGSLTTRSYAAPIRFKRAGRWVDVDTTLHVGAAYSRAQVHYLDVNGRESNTASPGGHITTTDFDAVGNPARQLTAANRELALAARTNSELNVLGLASMTTAQRAALLSTVNVLDSSGQHLTDTYGPLHQVTLEHALAASGTSAARAADSVVAARTHTHNTYDEGRPTDGSANASGLVTTAVTGSTIAGYATDADRRTTKTTYDWTLGEPTRSTVDPAGLAITTATGYNAAGDVISNSQPSSAGSDAGTTTTTYYSATGTGPCGGHPEWADQVCRTAPPGPSPAAAPTRASGSPQRPRTTCTGRRAR